MKHLSPWEEGLRNQLSNHRSVPPAKGWERLEASLKATQPLRKPFYRKSAFIATACSVAACLTIIVLLNPNDIARQSEISNPSTAHIKPSITPPAATTHATEQANAAKPNIDFTTKQCSQAHTAHPMAYNTQQHAIPTTICNHTGNTQETTNSREKETPLATANDTTTYSDIAPTYCRKSTPPAESTTKRTLLQATSTLDPAMNKKRKHAPLLTLHTGTTPSFHQREAGYYAKSNAYVSSGAGANNGQSESADMAMLMGKNINRDVQTHVSHRTPIQAGLSIFFPLTARWSLGTGITYTHLSSDIESGSNESFYHTEQHLHYIGVPLQISYTAFKSRPFNAYLTAGAQLEKCVKGSQSTAYHIDNAYKSNASHSKHLGNGLWQASFNLSTGLQANITKHIGLYFEPGVTYFVSDGSSLLTIRHEKPWQFTMQGGIRFTFGK